MHKSRILPGSHRQRKSRNSRKAQTKKPCLPSRQRCEAARDGAGGGDEKGRSRAEKRAVGEECPNVRTLGLTSGVLTAVSAIPFPLCHVAPTGGPDMSDSQLVAAHNMFSAFCYSLAEEVAFFLKFSAIVVVLQYPCHKCVGFEQFTLIYTTLGSFYRYNFIIYN